MTDNDENITELADAQTRRRNAAIAKFNKRRQDIGLQMTATAPTCYPGWIPLLADGYKDADGGDHPVQPEDHGPDQRPQARPQGGPGADASLR